MLIPYAKDHSINRVIASFIIPQNIMRPDILFNKLKQLPNFGDYQKKGVTTSKTINIGEDNFNISATEIKGFVFEQFNIEGKSINNLKVENTHQRSQIIFENKEYKNWTLFKDRLLKEAKTFDEHFDFFIEAVSLTYIDEFYWDSNEKININKIFNVESKIFNDKFINSFNGSIISITQSDKTNEYQLEEEKMEVIFNNNMKKIVINHTVAFKFSDIISYGDNIKLIEKSYTVAHKKNKELLQEILTSETQDLIKLLEP